MFRQQVRFVLLFGVAADFARVTDRLAELERERRWTVQRIWRPQTGRRNEVVVEHDYEDEAAYRAQTDAYVAAGADDEFTTLLAELAQLLVPGSAEEAHLVEQR